MNRSRILKLLCFGTACVSVGLFAQQNLPLLPAPSEPRPNFGRVVDKPEGALPKAPAGGGNQARLPLVTRADLQVVGCRVRRGPGDAGVPRDDLRVALRPGPGRPPPRAARLPARSPSSPSSSGHPSSASSTPSRTRRASRPTSPVMPAGRCRSRRHSSSPHRRQSSPSGSSPASCRRDGLIMAMGVVLRGKLVGSVVYGLPRT